MHCEKCDRVFPLACRRNHHLTCLPKTRGYASDEKIIRGEGRETLGAVRGDWAVAWPRQSASLGPTVGLNSMALVAGPAELLAYVRTPENERKVTEPLRGVLIEVANRGVIRHPWVLMKVLVRDMVCQALRSFVDSGAGDEEMVGPSSSWHVEESIRRISALLDDTQDEAPYTLQRLCELVLEPRKQYKRLHKLAYAVEKLLCVTTTVPHARNPPERPTVASLGAVNDPHLAANGEGPSANGGIKGIRSSPRKESSHHDMGLAGIALQAPDTVDIGPHRDELLQQAAKRARSLSPPASPRGSSPARHVSTSPSPPRNLSPGRESPGREMGHARHINGPSHPRREGVVEAGQPTPGRVSGANGAPSQDRGPYVPAEGGGTWVQPGGGGSGGT